MTLPEGWVFDAYIAQKGRCAISKKKMRKPIEPWDNFGPSLDRIDPSQGYTESNCQLTVVAINLAKRDMSVDEFEKLCVSVANQRKSGRK